MFPFPCKKVELSFFSTSIMFCHQTNARSGIKFNSPENSLIAAAAVICGLVFRRRRAEMWQVVWIVQPRGKRVD